MQCMFFYQSKSDDTHSGLYRLDSQLGICSIYCSQYRKKKIGFALQNVGVETIFTIMLLRSAP